MLLRMYMRWAEQHGYKVEWIEESPGEEAGIKSATIKIVGDNAYGWLKTESGVHRLVRISPFDSQARRHTSFASVWVYPVIDDNIEIEILDKDLRVDTYRASRRRRPARQHDRQRRPPHPPADRHRRRLPERPLAAPQPRPWRWRCCGRASTSWSCSKREEAAEASAEAKSDIGWGHQIRSYVLHPYKMVKDLRTGVETGNTQAVLDGDLDDFLMSALAGDKRADRGSEKGASAKDCGHSCDQGGFP